MTESSVLPDTRPAKQSRFHRALRKSQGQLPIRCCPSGSREDTMKGCPVLLPRVKTRVAPTRFDEGGGNECFCNSPSRKAYGKGERAVHGFRTGREELETGDRRWGARTQPPQRDSRRHRRGARMRGEG